MAKAVTRVVEVSHHQFALADIDAELDLDRDSQADRVRAQNDMLTISTDRASGNVPVTLEVHDVEPRLDRYRRHWSVVILAAITCKSGQLEIRELGPRKPQTDMHLAPGLYAVAVCMADLDSVSYDSNQGADHYKLLLWPSTDPVELTVWKTSPVMDKHRVAPLRSEGECLELTSESDRHTRYSAMAELARHATSRALACLLEVVNSNEEVDSLYAVSSLYLCPVLAASALARAFENESILVRHQVLVVISEFDVRSDHMRTVSRIVEQARNEPALRSLANYVADGLAL